MKDLGFGRATVRLAYLTLCNIYPAFPAVPCYNVRMKNKKMKLARLERDMTQEDLAQAVGVTRQTIGLMESGSYNPTLSVCTSICTVLGKTLDDLFWDASEQARVSKLSKRWYAVEVDVGRQQVVKQSIEAAAKERNFQHQILEVAIPDEVDRNSSMDCVMVKMVMTPGSWEIIRDTDGVKKMGRLLEKCKYLRDQ